jgi:hypothetical protein
MLTACTSPANYITARKKWFKQKFLETCVATFSFFCISVFDQRSARCVTFPEIKVTHLVDPLF